MSRMNGGDKKLGAGRVVAVAIENNKASQYAAKWAVDNLVPKDHCLLLIHVRQRVSSIPTPAGSLVAIDSNNDVARAYKLQVDNESKELFASFRVFFNRKSVQCKEILLEGMDIPKALIECISAHSVELLVLGAPSRSGIVRKFRLTDVPSLVSKGAPTFCTVYVISKGKISSVRAASAPLPPKPEESRYPVAQSSDRMEPQTIHKQKSERTSPERSAYCTPQLSDDEDTLIRSPFTRGGHANHKPYAPSIPDCDSDISYVSSARPSLERLFPTTYDDRHSTGSDFDARSSDSSYSGAKSIDMDYPPDDISSFNSQDTVASSMHYTNKDDMEAEMRRLKLELKQTMEMYSTACKEALTARQKATELQRWKKDEQKRLEEARIAEEEALAIAEMEKAKCKAAIEAAEASQKIAEQEAQKRLVAEMKARKEYEQKKRDVDTLAQGGVCAKYRRYTIEEIEEATNFLSDSLKIGEGGYGPVYRCVLDHTPVAVKVLRPDAHAAQGKSQFQQEVDVLSCIRHPNMVLLLGACPEYGCLVYEHMANGSLDDCLFRRGKVPPLPWQLRFRIAAEIATGLLFLHQTKPEPLVHRDLKPGNILLDRNYVSKISDVGLARLVPPSVADSVTQYRLTATAGTFCYIDPEYQQTGQLGIKSDIYSLGVMLLQIITARPPMALAHHVTRAIETGTFKDILDPAVEDWPVPEALQFAKLSLQCAELRKKDRPDLKQVILPQLNTLRDFAESQMPMMIFGPPPTAGYAHANNFSMASTIPDTISDTDSHSMYGYESRSSTSSVGTGRI